MIIEATATHQLQFDVIVSQDQLQLDRKCHNQCKPCGCILIIINITHDHDQATILMQPSPNTSLIVNSIKSTFVIVYSRV